MTAPPPEYPGNPEEPAGGQAYPPPNYGAGYPPPPPQPYSGYPQGPTPTRNGLGIAALIVGLVSIFGVVCFGFGGFVLGLVAIVLGILGRGRAKRGEANNGGVATAGIALGVLGIVVNAALLIFGVWGFMNLGGRDFVDCMQEAGNDQVAQQECADQFTHNVEDRLSITLTPTP